MKLPAGDLKTNTLLTTQKATIGPKGGTVAANEVGAAVSVSEQTLANPAPVSLAVAQRQFDSVLRDHYTFSPHGVVVSVKPDAIQPGGALKIQLPFQGDYDRFNTMMAVKNAAGKVMAIPAEPTADGKSLVGTLDQVTLQHLTEGTRAGATSDLVAFAANRVAPTTPPVLLSGVYQWKNGAFRQPLGDLSHKRVALCVHGINANLGDIQPLGAYIAGFKLSGAAQPYYDAVIGFQYTSNVPLAQIGTAMANQLHPLLASASATDLFAHSMGNLVSRYALETVSLANRLGPLIQHYASLAGPHAGIPFGDLTLLQTIAFLLPIECLPCLKDMLTHGANGSPETPFLSALNTQTNGPNFATAHYYSVSGNRYDTYEGIVGETIHGLYIAADLLKPNTWVEDGLVAVYTAQSKVLAKQSQRWKAGPTLPLNHHQFVSDQKSFDQIKSWILGWQ
jgi:hypothetical protein